MRIVSSLPSPTASTITPFLAMRYESYVPRRLVRRELIIWPSHFRAEGDIPMINSFPFGKFDPISQSEDMDISVIELNRNPTHYDN